MANDCKERDCSVIMVMDVSTIGGSVNVKTIFGNRKI